MNDPSLVENNGKETDLNTTSPTPPTKKKRSYKIPRRVFIFLTVLVALGIVSFIIYSAQNLPSLSEIENPQSNLSTQLISADGEVLQNFYTNQNRISVRLNEISPYLINALISTEDVRFYQHTGVDPKAPFSIIYGYLKRGKVRGGSTITQQLARNLYDKKVGKDRTAGRKIKEMIVSWILERKFTKEEILTGYLNTVNIVGNTGGIEMASKILFNKSARNLTIEESALVVAMLKGQGLYDPYRRPEKATTGRNVVINQMAKYGVLNAEEVNIDSLKMIPLSSSVINKQEQSHVRGIAPYFREHIRIELKKWCKEKGYNLYTDGLKVYTTIDSRMQRHAEDAVDKHLTSLQKDFDKQIIGKEPWRKDPEILERLMRQSYRYILAKKANKSKDEIHKEFRKPVPMGIFTWAGDIDTVMTPWDSLKYYSRFLETGFVSIDPTNGQVKAWVGGIDYKHFKYDHVAKGKRQVGSTFKPFVYAVAIENGWEPCHGMLNQRVVFDLHDGTQWIPKNSDGKVGGYMTLRKGLATSTNLITARLMKDLGPLAVVEMARRMGIKTKLDPVPSLCLGTTDLNVLELTSAYTAFANEGVHVDPILISRIEDRNGNILAEFVPKTRRALGEDKAYMMMELLKGVVDEPGGTAGRLRFRYGFENEIGGKTGTTQNHADGWFMGVTPNLVSGVWVGCADRQMRFQNIKQGQGANMALPIWAYYMDNVYKDKDIGLPQERFKKPRNLYVSFDCRTDKEKANPDGTENPTDSPTKSEFEKYE